MEPPEKVTSAAGTDNSFPGHEGIGIKNNSTTNQSDDKSNSEWNAAYPRALHPALAYLKLDSKQEAPEYGEDYRKTTLRMRHQNHLHMMKL